MHFRTVAGLTHSCPGALIPLYRDQSILNIKLSGWIELNRIYHWSLMQTEKPQPEGKRIMLETRFTEFPALSIDARVGISRSALETDV